MRDSRFRLSQERIWRRSQMMISLVQSSLFHGRRASIDTALPLLALGRQRSSNLLPQGVQDQRAADAEEAHCGKCHRIEGLSCQPEIVREQRHYGTENTQ